MISGGRNEQNVLTTMNYFLLHSTIRIAENPVNVTPYNYNSIHRIFCNYLYFVFVQIKGFQKVRCKFIAIDAGRLFSKIEGVVKLENTVTPKNELL